MNIVADTLGKAWLKYIERVSSIGNIIEDDREQIYEGSPIFIELSGDVSNDELLERHADQHVIDIYTKKMFSREIIPELNSTYGDRIFDNQSIDQFEWMINRLSNKWWTKAAVISLLKPNDPGPRIPCLTQIQLTVRNNSLSLYAIFRSQNAFRSYGNFLGLRKIQEMAAERLSTPIGSLSSFCISPHIYVSDIAAVRRIVDFEKEISFSNGHISSEYSDIQHFIQ